MSFLKKLLGCFFVWRIGRTSYEGADVIISHAGGDREDGDPGAINWYLESIIRDIYSSYRGPDGKPLPIMAQGEVAQCLKNLPIVGHIPRQRDYQKGAGSKAYLNTIDVVKIQLEECRKNGWKHPIVVSYQPHLWRLLAVFEKEGRGTLSGIAVAHVPHFVYEPRCSQKWMRTPWLNTPREVLCRLAWLFTGKI
jgi:hypothetical protein